MGDRKMYNGGRKSLEATTENFWLVGESTNSIFILPQGP